MTTRQPAPLTAKLGDMLTTIQTSKPKPPPPVVNKPTRKVREFSYLEPVYTRKLADAVGSHQRAGDLIGVSDASVGYGIRNDRIAQSAEMAAQLVYERDFEPKATEPENKAKMVTLTAIMPWYAAETLEPWLEENAKHFHIIK